MKLKNVMAFGLSLVAFAPAQDSVSVEAVSPVPMVEDAHLGSPFVMQSYTAGEKGEFQATLIRYPFSGSSPKAAILYIHGFNDYFFQKELAQRCDSAGYAFYAIDLHNYGRSLRKGERLGELRDIASYYPELDSALAKIRQIEGAVPQVLMGHSTGGLVASLYAKDRDNGKNIAAIVLNSPFLEMNMAWPVRKLGVPLISLLGGSFPDIPVPRSEDDFYFRSLHVDGVGEWQFSKEWKVPASIPVDFGWCRAIHQGHVQVQEGMALVSPILVMFSNCSAKDDEWSEEYTRCDGVLDVEHIQEYGAHLGPDVQLQEIQDGLHDLFLSKKSARDQAYQSTFKFLDSHFQK